MGTFFTSCRVENHDRKRRAEILPASDEWKPSDHGIGVALEMEDFDAAIAELRSAEVKFFWEPFESPVCHIAVVQDPDGNKIGIHKLRDA